MPKRPAEPDPTAGRVRSTRENLGFLLAKASQRWNELLSETFRRAGYGDVRPAHGSILIPLFEEDGLRIGELARRSRLSKQAMTALVKVMERRRLIVRRGDPIDARASLIYLTPRTRRFKVVAETVLQKLDELVDAKLTPDRRAELAASLKALMNLTP